MANFQSALEVGLYSKLTGASALITVLGGTAVYNGLAPQNPGTKYVVFQWQGGGDMNESPTRMRNLLYTVRGIATTKATALAIDTAIDDALHNATLTVTGWTNIQCHRETDINFIEQDAGGCQPLPCGRHLPRDY